MKDIVNFINEKANFIVKKHVTCQYKVAYDASDFTNKTICKNTFKYNDKNFTYLVLSADMKNPIFNDDAGNPMLKTTTIIQIIENDEPSLSFGGNFYLNSDRKYLTPSRSDIKMIELAENYYNENKPEHTHKMLYTMHDGLIKRYTD